MAQQDYPQQGFGSPEQQYSDDPHGPSPPPAEGQAHAHAGGKKRRQYAGQAYDFGAGANTQPPAGASYSGVTAGYEGYGPPEQQGFQQEGFQQQGYGYGAGAPQDQQQAYGQPQYPAQGGGVGGYQPPDGIYAGAGGQPPQSGVDQIAAGMNNMGFHGTPQPPPQQPPIQRPHLNQLHPTDMMNQPFQVSELDLPPPPIVLPPNVSSVLAG